MDGPTTDPTPPTFPFPPPAFPPLRPSLPRWQVTRNPNTTAEAFEGTSYPAIIDLIFNIAPDEVLLVLRATCRAWRDVCDTLLLHHLKVSRQHGYSSHAHVYSPSGIFFNRHWQHRFLKYVKALDILGELTSRSFPAWISRIPRLDVLRYHVNITDKRKTLPPTQLLVVYGMDTSEICSLDCEILVVALLASSLSTGDGHLYRSPLGRPYGPEFALRCPPKFAVVALYGPLDDGQAQDPDFPPFAREVYDRPAVFVGLLGRIWVTAGIHVSTVIVNVEDRKIYDDPPFGVTRDENTAFRSNVYRTMDHFLQDKKEAALTFANDLAFVSDQEFRTIVGDEQFALITEFPQATEVIV